jgi:hypothetical protein
VLLGAERRSLEAIQALIGDWVAKGRRTRPRRRRILLSIRSAKDVIVRKNYAEYPAQNGRPAFRHDDLVIIYLDDASKRPRAIYFDSEGHTIRYAITVSGDSLVFESEPGEPGTHYRLTQTPSGGRLSGKFESHAPGEAQYKTYIEFTARRK